MLCAVKTGRVRQRLKRFAFLVGIVFFAGCAGNASLSDLTSQPIQETAIPIAGQQLSPERQWNRPFQPQSNSTFMMIDGIPYYRIGPGDIMEMQVYLNQASTTFTLQVDPAGDISLPAHISRDRIRISGLTNSQAEEALRSHLSRTLRLPQVSLRVETHGSSFVTLLGEVGGKTNTGDSGEGRYAITERTTLLEFILAHSVFNDQSDKSAVMVTDATGRSGIFDLSTAMYAADQSQNPVLDRGDNVLVPSTTVTRSRIFVIGEVVNRSMLQPRTGMTVLDAIAEAGGPTEQARTKWVTLVRGRGTDARLYQIPFRKIWRTGDMEANVTLMPGDIIHLGTSTYESVMKFFRESWAIMQTAIVATILIDTINP